MINLLPYDTKKQIKAARTNTTLIKYLFISIFAIAFIILSSLMVYVLLINSQPKTTTTANASQTSESEYSTLKSQLDNMYLSFSSTKPILQQQISTSEIIIGIGANLPPNVVLGDLSINSSKIGIPISLSAKAKSSSDVAKIKESLQKSSMFTNISLQSEKTNSNDTSGYPVSVTINLTINRGA